MCGLIGFVGKHPDLVLIRNLLLTSVDYGRGRDGWGVMTYAPQHGAYVIKDKIPPEVESVDESLNELHATDACVIIGHVRQATSGGREVQCNHPLSHKHAVIVHNGSVDNHEELRKKYKIPKDAPPVDSYLIAYLLGESETVSEGIKRVFKECSGRLIFIAWSSKAPFTLWTASDSAYSHLYQFRYRGQDYFASETSIFKDAVATHKAGYKEIPSYRESYGLGGVIAWGESKMTRVMELSEVQELKKLPKVEKKKVHIPRVWRPGDKIWPDSALTSHDIWFPASDPMPITLAEVRNKQGSTIPNCEFCSRPGPINYQDINLCEECFELLAN